MSDTKKFKKRPAQTDLNLYTLNPSLSDIIIENDKELYEKVISNIIEDFFNLY